MNLEGKVKIAESCLGSGQGWMDEFLVGVWSKYSIRSKHTSFSRPISSGEDRGVSSPRRTQNTSHQEQSQIYVSTASTPRWDQARSEM